MARVTALLLLLLLVLAGRPAEACTCAGNIPPCQSAWDADAVFLGRVVEVIRENTPLQTSTLRVRLEVTEAFRGDVRSEVTVVTGSGGGDCGYPFVTGQTYLIYGTWQTSRAALYTGICQRTKLATQAAEDLAYLRQLTQQSSGFGTIQGTARRGDINYESRPGTTTPFPGLRVIAQSGGTRYEGVTDTDGRYSIAAPPGSYSVSVDVPDGLWAVTSPGQKVLRGAQACVSADVSIRSDGRIAGRVVDSRSTPVGGFLVHAVPWSSWTTLTAAATSVTTADGTFELTRLPPGDYIIRTTAPIGAEQTSSTRYVHPGSATISEANRITLAASQRKTLPDFALPSSASIVSVDGVVRDAAGRPAEGVTVHLMETRDGQQRQIVGTSRPTTSDGRFRISAVAGSSYQLVAEWGLPPLSASRVLRGTVFDLTTNVAEVELTFSEPR